MRCFIVFIIYFLIFFTHSCKQANFYDHEYEKKIDSIYTNAASYYFSTGKLDLALDTITKIYYSTKNPTIWDDKNFYLSSGQISGRSKGDFKKALNYFDTILAIVENGNLNKISINTYADIFIEKAHAYFELGNYEKSVENYFKVESILSNHVNDCEKMSLTRSIAFALYKQKQFNQAAEYFKKEYKLIKECNLNNEDVDPSSEQQALNNIGLSFFKQQQFDSAEVYFNKAIHFIKNNRFLFRKNRQASEAVYQTCLGVVLGNLAKIYTHQKDYDSAIKLLSEAIYYNTTLGIERNDAQICRVQLAEIYYTIHDFSKMISVLNDYNKEVYRSKYLNLDVDWYRLMSKYYYEKNDFKNELFYYKTYIQKRDSINGVQNLNQATSITRDLENKQQKLQIDLLQKDNQLSKLYIWIIASGFVLIAIISFLIFRNYKKEKHNLKLLTQLNNEIIQQQKALQNTLNQIQNLNHEKDRILNVVAHDLRNPIGAIANFLEIIQTKYEHSNDEQKIIQNSQQAAVRSLHLINDLLEVNKINSDNLKLNKQEIDLISLIEESISQVQYKTISKQQKISFNKNTDQLIINVDEEKLQRVIINLLDNAIKFSYINTTIYISLYQQENNILLQVKDKGVGIPNEMQEHLFTSSISIKRKGTHNETSNGLGLAICKQIIEAHNGKVWVISEDKKGSTFNIELPLHKDLSDNI